MKSSPIKCMFHKDNVNCDQLTKREHIIQKKLGGTLSSKQLLCNNCNYHFSRSLDEELINLYRPILINIAPIVPGNLKKIIMKIDSTNSVLPINIRAGGVADIKKGIQINRDEKGNVKQIFARDNISIERLIEIAKLQGVPIENADISHVPISEYESEYSFETKMTEKTVRAVLLDLFELIKFCTINKNIQDIISFEQLKPYRKWIREGYITNKLTIPALPFAPIESILDFFFKPSVFSHKMVISYEKKSDWFILSAQFFDTMPWLFILPNLLLNQTSFSILYKKALVDGSDFLDIVKRPLLNKSNLQWSRFSTATPDSIKFARIKFLMALREQQSRSAYVIDMKDDEKISQMLNNYADDFRKKSDNPEVQSIVKVIGIRYAKSSHLKEIEAVAQKKAEYKLSKKSSISKKEILIAYRECLKFIANIKGYGFPILLDDPGPIKEYGENIV